MSTTTNPKTPSVGGADAPNNKSQISTFSPSLHLTFETVIQDVASWWCYAILKQGDLNLFDELDDILDSLPGPFPAASPLSIRLRCLVPWQELLKQLHTPGCSVGEKRFETIQDKLILLHQGFFSKTYGKEEFNEVLKMVQTHAVLSKLYCYFSKSDGAHTEQTNATNKLLDQSNADWESIYLESDGVPPSLLDLVDKSNGWDHEDRRDHILQIVSFPDSVLTYKQLKEKMQSLLLHWFEIEIHDSNEAVPELLRKRYRGIGYGGEENVPKDAIRTNESFRNTIAVSNVDTRRLREETSLVMTSQQEEEEQSKEQQQKSRIGRRLSPKKKQQKQQQQRISENKRKNNSLDQEQESLVSESSDCDDWSDFEPEEELRRLKLHRERQKRLRNFSQEQRVSAERRMEQLLPMPVGESSYSEASPRRKLTRGRKRRHLHDQYYCHHAITNPTTTVTGLNNEQGFWGTSESTSSSSGSSSSSSDFDDSDDEVIPWTREQDEALRNGIKWNGYGNWAMILKGKFFLLGSKDEDELRNRANLLLAQR